MGWASWRELNTSTADEIAHILKETSLEWGLVDELVMDNGTGFHSETLEEMLDKWNVPHFFKEV